MFLSRDLLVLRIVYADVSWLKQSHVRDNDDTVKVHTKDCVYGRADGDGGILLRKLTGWRGWVSSQNLYHAV